MKHNALKRSGHVALAVLVVVFSHPALAATIIVDETTCTLVDAMTAANTDAAVGGCAAGSGADTIELTTDVTLTTVNNDDCGPPCFDGETGLPVVESDISVAGGGFTIERGAGAPEFRLFLVNGTLSLDDVKLTNGGFSINGYGFGGAIANSGSLTLTNSTVSGSHAYCGAGIANTGTAILTNTVISQNVGSTNGFGGGIENYGVLELTNSRVSGNYSGSGGGIWSPGSLTLTTSTVSDNRASFRGGGIRNSGVAELTRSTVSDNLAYPYQPGPPPLPGSGGAGIDNAFGSLLTLTNSTVSGNIAGAGIRTDSTSTAMLTNSTVSGNYSGSSGGIEATYGSVVVTNSIVAGSCVGNITDNGNNFGQGCASTFAPITPDVDFDTNLADNGGPTQTHGLLPGSVAIDAAGDCGLDTDQRGILRDDGACDSGSFEFRLCGNGILDPGEECDDGNNLSCDGCSPDCEIEVFVCGDGILNEACEECDDGAETPTCDDDCTLPECGDANVNTTAGEECDDGNNISCDGCSAICEHEMGFECGDGGLNTECGEECDDGNNEDGDGCAADCTLEEPVPVSSPLGLLVLLAILMTVSWAILRPKWGARRPT